MKIVTGKITYTRTQKILLIIFGLTFLSFSIFSVISNYQSAIKPGYVTFSFCETTGWLEEMNARSGRCPQSSQHKFPAYALLLYPTLFFWGGLLMLTAGLGFSAYIKYLAALFTVFLGAVLTYFFQFSFPGVLIPILFLILGLILLIYINYRKLKELLP